MIVIDAIDSIYMWNQASGRPKPGPLGFLEFISFPFGIIGIPELFIVQLSNSL